MASNLPVATVEPTTSPTTTVPMSTVVPTLSPPVSPAPVSPTPLSLTVMPPPSAVSPSEQGWTIKVKSADGTTTEMILEPTKGPEQPAAPAAPAAPMAPAKDSSDGFEKGPEKEAVYMMKSPPAPLTGKLRFYLIVQYCLNAVLAICIIAIMILTYVKYNGSKNVDGAWPANPVTSPTAIMMVVSFINLTVDSINLLAQCCGARAIKAMNHLVLKARKATGVLLAVAPAIAAGFCKFGLDASSGNDLWGWSCSEAAHPFQSVNSCNLICNSTTAAFDLQVLQVAFQLLSILVPMFSQYRLSKTDGSPDGIASADAGDVEAANLIKESTSVIEILTKK